MYNYAGFTWPDSYKTYKVRQDDLAWGEKMTNPDVIYGSASGWATRGSSYNWFDKKTVWGGLEYRAPDNLASR